MPLTARCGMPWLDLKLTLLTVDSPTARPAHDGYQSLSPSRSTGPSVRSTRWARAICLGSSIWYASPRPAALARLHASLAFASHAVHAIAIAARLWHGVLLSSLACYFLLHRSAPEAIPVGGRAGCAHGRHPRTDSVGIVCDSSMVI